MYNEHLTSQRKVQTKYISQIKNEIKARWLRYSSRQTLLQENFFGTNNVDFFHFQSHKFLFFSKIFKRNFLNCKIKNSLILKILNGDFGPQLRKTKNTYFTPLAYFL